MVGRGRDGRSTLGCLFALLLLAAAGYFLVGVGEAYWRFYSFRDAMRQQARFATRDTRPRDVAAALRAKADSLDLPEQAVESLRVRRTRAAISISSEYAETVDLHFVRREIRFAPSAERSF
jgi:hypothetical protein